jgi:thioredoxin 1
VKLLHDFNYVIKVTAKPFLGDVPLQYEKGNHAICKAYRLDTNVSAKLECVADNFGLYEGGQSGYIIWDCFSHLFNIGSPVSVGLWIWKLHLYAPCFGSQQKSARSNNPIIIMAEKETFRSVINGPKPVLVDFTASWCGPCKTMAPILEQLRASIGEAIRIIKIDVDQNNALAAELQVSGVPTLILYKNGMPIWRQSGVVPLHTLQSIIQSNLQKA